jgi:hypothetical protein
LKKIDAALAGGTRPGAVVSAEEKKRQEDAREIVRIALGGAPRKVVQLLQPGPQAQQQVKIA